MFPVAVYQNGNHNADLELIVELVMLAIEYVQKAAAVLAEQN